MENNDILNAMGINEIKPKTEQQKMEHNQNKKAKEHTSYIKSAKILSAILFIVSIIGGIALANVYEIQSITHYGSVYSKFNTPLMISSWVIGFFIYFVVTGLACIVENTEK